MNGISLEFLFLVASRPVKEQKAWDFFGGQYEFLNQCARHFPALVEWDSTGKLVVLTDQGKDYMESQEEIRQNQKAEEAQRAADEAKAICNRKQELRHNWRVSIVTALAGGVLALVVEHFQAILSFLRNVFHW